MTTGRTLARAGLIVSAAFLVSRVLGWVRLVVIADACADPAELDAFFAAFRIPDLLFQLVAAGALRRRYPGDRRAARDRRRARAWRVVSTVANLMLVGLAGARRGSSLWRHRLVRVDHARASAPRRWLGPSS